MLHVRQRTGACPGPEDKNPGFGGPKYRCRFLRVGVDISVLVV